MKDIVDEMFLIINIKAEKFGASYSYQVEHVYSPRDKHIYPRQRILKYQDGKLERKILIKSKFDTINYLNNEMKLYN